MMGYANGMPGITKLVSLVVSKAKTQRNRDGNHVFDGNESPLWGYFVKTEGTLNFAVPVKAFR